MNPSLYDPRGNAIKYLSGDEIRAGDKVLWGGAPAEIEFVIEAPVGDPVRDWHWENDGPGAMVVEVEPKSFGRVYLQDTENDEDLIFVSRADTN